MGRPREACGVYGVYDFQLGSVFPYIYWGLLSQNHRGQQSYGYLTFDGAFHSFKMLGLVPRMGRRKLKRRMAELPGNVGIGNVRYSTSGQTDYVSLMKDSQPVLCECPESRLAVSYNGNIVNAVNLRKGIASTIGEMSTTGDSEILCKKLCVDLMTGKDLAEVVRACMQEVEGAYSVVGISGAGELFAFRDKHGIKPLCLGFSADGQVCAFSSETVGLDINGLNHNILPVEPGELIVVSKQGVRHLRLIDSRKAFCCFEFAYFARPDSILNGSSQYVYEIRASFGGNLSRIARQNGIARRIDCVVPVPETAEDAAYGFHVESGLPLERAMRRHRYVTDRAFITLPQERQGILGKKVNVLGDKLRGKCIALVDDSIVRGDTTRSVIERMREAGVKEIHVYVTFPRILSPCFYGIDMATFEELIGASHLPEEVAKLVAADSVTYQPLENYIAATGLAENELCLACLTGKYPTPLAQKQADDAREKVVRGMRITGRVYEQSP